MLLLLLLLALVSLGGAILLLMMVAVQLGRREPVLQLCSMGTLSALLEVSLLLLVVLLVLVLVIGLGLVVVPRIFRNKEARRASRGAALTAVVSTGNG